MIDMEVGHTFDRRSALFLTTGAVLTSVLVLRMLQMQLFNYRDYKKKSENNSFRLWHYIRQFIVFMLFPKNLKILMIC